MERPNPDNDPDSVPTAQPEDESHDPKPKKPKVTPLDEDKHLESGIEIKET